MTTLPKKISPCPIVEAVLEIRFSSKLPPDAVFGVLYSLFSSEYSPFEQLPITQIPAMIRDQDPTLRYGPHYRSKKGQFQLQIGPKTVAISVIGEYCGWDVFSKEINSTFKKVKKSGVIDVMERLGLRYINILEGVNVFEHSNFVISLAGKTINRKTKLTTEITSRKAKCTLNITSDAEVTLGDQNKIVNGSVVDIDVIIDINKKSDIYKAIERAHDIEKGHFYKIMTKDYIETLNPEY